MKRTYLLFSIVAVIGALFTASGVRATDEFTASGVRTADEFTVLPPLPSYAAPVLRACKINVSKDGSKYVTIEAGPDRHGGLSNQFPMTCKNGIGKCSCGDALTNPTCLQWQYRWTITGFDKASLSEALVSAASNVTVFSSDPPGARVLQPLIAPREHVLNFPVSGGPGFVASYFTPLNVTPGPSTAGFVGKSGSTPLHGRCALAGAESLTVPANLATPASETRTYTIPGPCVFSVSVDPTTGKVIQGSVKLVSGSPTDCSINETNALTVDNKPVINIGAGQWTEQGSCSFCYANSGGGKSCVTCTTCTVKNGVCSR